jgi:hypothetical protein
VGGVQPGKRRSLEIPEALLAAMAPASAVFDPVCYMDIAGDVVADPPSLRGDRKG